MTSELERIAIVETKVDSICDDMQEIKELLRNMGKTCSERGNTVAIHTDHIGKCDLRDRVGKLEQFNKVCKFALAPLTGIITFIGGNFVWKTIVKTFS